MTEQLVASQPSLVESLATVLANATIDDKHDSDGRCSEASGNQCSNANSNHEVDESDADSDDNGIDSDTPSNFNASDHLFHINFLRTLQHMPADIKRFKNGTRRSCTFTNEQMRQIERENRILLEKILSNGPLRPQRRQHSAVLPKARQGSANSSSSFSRISSAAVNRKKRQQKIDSDNDILRKKLERIARRPIK